MSTLYIARVLEDQHVAAGASQIANLPQAAAVGCRRIVVECVTVHPDAGLPSADDDGHKAQRLFLARLLTDADDAPDDNGIDGLNPGSLDDDQADAGIWASRRIRLLDIGFDDAFWHGHQDQWWSGALVGPNVPLRDWLATPSDSCPYQVATFEVHADPGSRPGLTRHTFDSTAHW